MRWLLVAVAVWVPVTAFAQDVSPACSTVGQNLTVRDVMQDVYLWYRELPDVDPARFSSPESYLDALRYRPLDTSFSFISTKASDEAFFGRSQFIGFGFSMALRDGRVMVTEVFPGGPAADAGWQRGAELLAIDGVSVSVLIREASLDGALAGGTGAQARLAWRDANGVERSATLVKREVTIPTVSAVTTFEQDGRRVGYLVLRTFVDTTPAALDDAFATLRAQRVDDLVIDVRYNGGGLVSSAQHLAGLVGGTHTAHQVFAELAHSDRQRSRDRRLRFPTPRQALGASRVVVVTSRASASASELIVSALRPFLSVRTVGARTLGKPVGQYSIGFCDRVLHPVAFVVQNARRDAPYFSGIPADCPVDDDVTRALGDPAEASLAMALAVLRQGTCAAGGTNAGPSGSPLRAADRSAATTESPRPGEPLSNDLRAAVDPTADLPRAGWSALLNAW